MTTRFDFGMARRKPDSIYFRDDPPYCVQAVSAAFTYDET